MSLPRGVRIGLIAAFAIAYPFLTAWLVRHGGSGLVLALCAVLSLWRGIRAGRTVGRLGYGVLGILLAVAAPWAEDRAIRLIPAFVYLSLAWLFGHTLRHPPSLLERFVRLQFPEFKPGIAEYLRGWTWAWTVCFAAAAGICAVLALAGADRPWVVYTGIGVYLQMGLLVVAEYLYRPRRFPELEIPPPQDSLRVMLRRGHEVFRELRG
jgi:uncharacterized membrane protein